ncbi:MAG: VOC family protein [Acidimicrobiia bacterium]|nr:VOC family protein [Acidimicrobiia bacterium]MDH5291252.1 VOC family protein [Acidimicrobiia bacterium]
MTTTDLPATGLAAGAPGAAAIDRLHHLAYVTHDTAATVDFYEGVLGLRLVHAIMGPVVPSTKAPYPHIHTFFQLASGENVAFFECPNLNHQPPERRPGYEDFEHLALAVATRDDVDRWREYLQAKGLDVITNDHGIIYSIYFRDPVNDIRLEITTTTDPSWSERGAAAHQAVADWTATRDGAAARGEDVAAALGVLATARKPGKDGH